MGKGTIVNLDMELFGAYEWQLFISGGSCLVITSWPASGIHEIVIRPNGLVNKTTIHCQDRGLTHSLPVQSERTG